MKNRKLKIVGMVLIGMVELIIVFAKVKRVTPLSWGPKEINQPMFSNTAINGYDAVSYFVQNSPQKGLERYSYRWQNAIWHFMSKENMGLFIQNPEKFAPQFGGYCAFAVSKGFTANTNPGSFEIIDDKLYLFADDDIKSDWMGNQQENLKLSMSNWK